MYAAALWGRRRERAGTHLTLLCPVTARGLTYDGKLGDDQSMPKTCLQIIIPGVIFMEGNCAPEEELWEALSVMGYMLGGSTTSMGSPGSSSSETGCWKGSWSTGGCPTVILLATSFCVVREPVLKTEMCDPWSFSPRSVNGSDSDPTHCCRKRL